jgi:hypothetical protein
MEMVAAISADRLYYDRASALEMVLNSADPLLDYLAARFTLYHWQEMGIDVD